MGRTSPLAVSALGLLLSPIAWFLFPGCNNGQPALPKLAAGPAEDLGIEFDPAAAGTLSGRVTWEGPIPRVPPIVTRPCAVAMEGLQTRIVRENPNAPDVDPSSRAV